MLQSIRVGSGGNQPKSRQASRGPVLQQGPPRVVPVTAVPKGTHQGFRFLFAGHCENQVDVKGGPRFAANGDSEPAHESPARAERQEVRRNLDEGLFQPAQVYPRGR